MEVMRLIRYSINGGSLTNIASSSGEISLDELSNGDYSIEFTLHSSDRFTSMGSFSSNYR